MNNPKIGFDCCWLDEASEVDWKKEVIAYWISKEEEEENEKENQ